MRALLVSTYDMGRQPFGLASPAAWLRESGVEVSTLDLSRERLAEDVVQRANLIAFFLPMHTATRLALPVIDRVRELNPGACLCAYGLYASLNEPSLRDRGVTEVLPAEFEDDLRRIAIGLRKNQERLPRLAFRVPDRRGLPALKRYACLQFGSGQRIVGYTEASRGCKHRCRHCPIVPVYAGRFRVVPISVIMADIHAQVADGAEHITFGDPDFFNGIGHAMKVIESFAREFPSLTYDVTIKVEHLLAHADRLEGLRSTGCAFVTTAVESIDDQILSLLEKGHTRADFERVVELCRAVGLTLAPTFVPFTPWTTLGGYCELLQAIDRLDLVENVAPIQLSIRLLVTEGSRLLELPDIRSLVGTFNGRTLTYPWRNADGRVDALQERLSGLVGSRLSGSRADVFASIWELAHEAAGIAADRTHTERVMPRAVVPYLNEPWYC